MKKLKMIILGWVVKGLFKGLTDKDVFKIIHGKFYLDNELVPEEQAEVYRDQALKIQDMTIWKLINDKLVYSAEEIMFQKSKTTDDLFFGKVMLYNLDLINKYLQKI